MSWQNDAHIVQTCYPKIYLACHTRHQRAASSAVRLSARDSSLLAHLGLRTPVSPAVLARHLSVTKSTLSAALKRLAGLGYVAVSHDASDARRVELRLTPRGVRAMRDSSVLEAPRVRRLLLALRPDERRQALHGLALLAAAADRVARGEA
jgi:DNA-binding MarR family transcriptional regulator